MHVTLVMLEDGRRGREILLRRPEVVIGRAKGCKVRITSADVSRQHCRLTITPGCVTVQDLGSVNGTLVNGRLCQGIQSLLPYDQLQVGPVTFRVEFDPLAVEPAKAPVADELTVEPEDLIEFDDDQPQRKSQLPWAQLAESSTPPPTPPSSVEHLPTAELDD